MLRPVSIFQLIVQECGIASLLAKGVVQRSCFRAGILEPEDMQAEELPAVLMELAPMLELYLGHNEAIRRLRSIRSMKTDIEVVFDLANPLLDE